MAQLAVPKLYVNFDDLLGDLHQICASTPNYPPSSESLPLNPYYAALRDILGEEKRAMELRVDIQQLKLAEEDVIAKGETLQQSIDHCLQEAAESRKTYTNGDDDAISTDMGVIQRKLGRGKAAIETREEQLVEWLSELLNAQSEHRPISAEEVDFCVAQLRMRFQHWCNELKMAACNQLLLLKSQLSANSRRRNFTKEATRILNAYFERHMMDPYPNEATKQRLADECGITLAQVSNWFGNKRIRFRKGLQRQQLRVKEEVMDR